MGVLSCHISWTLARGGGDALGSCTAHLWGQGEERSCARRCTHGVNPSSPAPGRGTAPVIARVSASPVPGAPVTCCLRWGDMPRARHGTVAACPTRARTRVAHVWRQGGGAVRAGRKRRLHVAPRAPPPPTPAWAREGIILFALAAGGGPKICRGGTSHGAKLPAMLPGDSARLGAGSVLPRPCTPAGPPLLQTLPSSLPPFLSKSKFSHSVH